ncbi:hypothetical protein VTK56DRAFT_3135 [Thermocarpiscus australiensis]
MGATLIPGFILGSRKDVDQAAETLAHGSKLIEPAYHTLFQACLMNQEKHRRGAQATCFEDSSEKESIPPRLPEKLTTPFLLTTQSRQRGFRPPATYRPSRPGGVVDDQVPGLGKQEPRCRVAGCNSPANKLDSMKPRLVLTRTQPPRNAAPDPSTNVWSRIINLTGGSRDL